MKRNKGIGVVGVLIIVILALALVVVGYWVGHKNSPVEIPPIHVTPTVTVSSQTPTVAVVSSVVATSIAGQMRYTNPSAGISFLFAKSVNGQTFDVKEVGDMIYVYDTKFPYTQGQYVKIFPKNPADTLDQAIQKTLLSGIDPKDCYVAAGNTDTDAKFPSTYIVRTLKYPTNPNSDIPEFAQTNKCPATYAATNGISYFLGDTAHAKIFLFFSIGQYSIFSAPNTTLPWQDTVQFLN